MLAWYAALGEANAADTTALHERDGPPELRRPQRGDVTTGPCAENEAVDRIALVAGYHRSSGTATELRGILDELAQRECEA